MAQKKSENTGFRKKLLAELQSNVRGGLKRVSGNEILLTPLMDVYETPEEFMLVFAVPGMGKEDIEVKILEHELIVEEIKGTAKKAFGETVIKELEHGRYLRKVPLTSEVEYKSVNGTIDRGLLTITLKKLKLEVSDGGDEEDKGGKKSKSRKTADNNSAEDTKARKGKTKSRARSRK